MSCYNVMAVLINHRTKKAIGVQEVLTKHGCIIKMRLGLHETGDFCSEGGLVILQLCGTGEQIAALEADLNAIDGVKAKNMNIGFD
ncbi:MAG: hypothetical protein N2645_14650 [Clostridia bacterium]|nr:hypothetical protein [Clostridia bacterium]